MLPPPRWPGDAGSSSRCAYVCLLRSLHDGTAYLGWTTDMGRRLAAHNRGLTPSTRAKRPWRLIGYEVYPDSAAAKARERSLKHNPRMRALFSKRVAVVAARIAEGDPSEVVG